MKRMRNEAPPWMGSSQLAIAFVRGSSRGQEGGRGKKTQDDRVSVYTHEAGLAVEKTVAVTETASKPDERKMFNQMLEDAKAQKIKHIVFLSVDRAVRNTWDWGRLSRDIRERHFVFHFVQEALVLWHGSTDAEWVQADLQALVATAMARSISTGTRRGVADRVADGWYPGRAPLGYYNQSSTTSEGRRKRRGSTIETDEVEAALVRHMADLRLQGLSCQSIADAVNLNDGYATATGVKRKIDGADVYRILTNPFYSGRFRWRKELHDGLHEPLFDQETWQRLQATFGQRSAGAPRSRAHHLFQGLLKCADGNCGRAITSEEKRNVTPPIRYWHCTNSRRVHDRITNVNERTLVAQVWTALSRVTLPDDSVKEAIAEINKPARGRAVSVGKRRARLSRRIDALAEQREVLMRRFTDGRISEDRYDRETDLLDDERDLIARRLDDLAVATDSKGISLGRARTLLAELPDVWNRVGVERKRTLLHALVANATLKKQTLTLGLLAPFAWSKPRE